MAVYESITYSRQDAFGVEESLRCNNFELERGESATKMAYHLCGNAALIGEFVISEEGRSEILHEARRIFRLLCAGKLDSLPLTDGRVLAVACVLLTRNSVNATATDDNQDHAEIWQPILEGLNFPDIQKLTGCSEQVARRYLCDVLKNPYNVRFFADGGKKYYNTLRIHALSPEWSIKNLYNVLYGFYHKNLECSYYPGSNVASMFVSGMRRRWDNSGNKGNKDKIQSDHVASSLRELFLMCPRYMSAVCDALLEKIDRIVQGDLTKLDDKNRWDVLLQEWYTSKTAYEKNQMTNDRKAAVRRKVVDKRENIRPEYVYDNKGIYLSIPGIRLPEIQEAPVIQLYQNDQLIYEHRLAIYGNDVLWSTRSHRLLLDQTTGVNWKKRFCFMLRILSGKNEIYCSGSDLYRDYLCFTPAGNETRLIRCGQMLRLIVRKSAKLVIVDPEDQYTEEVAPYRSIVLWTESVDHVTLNGENILEDNRDGGKRMWAYLTPEADAMVCAKFEEASVAVYNDRPTLHVVLQKQTDAKNYQVALDGDTSQLYQYPWNNGQFQIPLPALKEQKHVVQIKDFDSGEIVFQRSYTVVSGLNIEFDCPFYLDRECNGTLFINTDSRKLVQDFQLQPGMDIVSWKMAGLTFEITVPKITAEIVEKNAFYIPKAIWYEELRDSFLTIRKPEDVNCAVIFGDKLLAPNTAGRYEIGTEIVTTNQSTTSTLLGVVFSTNNLSLEWKLTDVHFRESFQSSPVLQDDRKILWNPVEAGYIGGDENPTFRLELENDQQELPFQYALHMEPEIIERNFPCSTGTYSYTLWLTNRKQIFVTLPDIQLLKGEVYVEDPPEDRFVDKHIILTRAYYCDPIKGIEANAKMKHDGALIDFIQYEGIKERDGKQLHEYSGIMYFRTANGWKKFSEEETEFFEKTNPVFFTVEEDDSVIMYLEEDDPLMLNIKSIHQGSQYSGAQIFSRKNELTREEQGQYLAFADKFRFIERDN